MAFNSPGHLHVDKLLEFQPSPSGRRTTRPAEYFSLYNTDGAGPDRTAAGVSLEPQSRGSVCHRAILLPCRLLLHSSRRLLPATDGSDLCCPGSLCGGEFPAEGHFYS